MTALPKSSSGTDGQEGRGKKAHITRATPPLEDTIAALPESSGGDAGQASSSQMAHSAGVPLPLDDLIAEIIAAHRERCFWMDKRKRDDNALGAYVRTSLRWSRALPKAEGDAIKARAKELIDIGERHVKLTEKILAKARKTGDGTAPLPPIPDELGRFANIILSTITMRREIDATEAAHTKRMADLAAQCPGAKFVLSQKGLDTLGLAIIIAEAGRDLSLFPNKGKLYKRLGLAVVGKIRQGGLTKSAPKTQWIEHGYSRQRRSRIWTIGTAALMAKNERYRQIYLDRKAYETACAEAKGLIVAPSSKIPEKRRAEFMSVGHVHARARRYAEKKMICDIWRAWRRDKTSDVGLHIDAPQPSSGGEGDMASAPSEPKAEGAGQVRNALLTERQAMFAPPSALAAE